MLGGVYAFEVSQQNEIDVNRICMYCDCASFVSIKEKKKKNIFILSLPELFIRKSCKKTIFVKSLVA